MPRKTNRKDTVTLNSYAKESFLKIADGDYIAARALYRNKCIEQFFWYAQQCLEKYMKGILLINKYDKSDIGKIENGGHCLDHLHEKMCSVRIFDQCFEFPEWMEKIIQYFNMNGDPDVRYRQKALSSGWFGCDLNLLDATVFQIRRYCQPINGTRVIGHKNISKETNNKMILAKLKSLCLENISQNWRQFYICGGLIEEVMNKKDDPRRESLIWKNVDFGNGKTRPSSVSLPDYKLSTIPYTSRHPDEVTFLRQFIFIPKKKR